jgi:peptide/nickel transport system substrate-binding protein
LSDERTRALSRRAALKATLALGVGLSPLASFAPSRFGASDAHARGRTSVGGRISVRVPWPILAMDPHRLEDATAAIFGEALFDTLYARDETGAFVASLAEADPEPEGAMLRVRIRTGLRTAKGHAFEARDAAAAIARSRTLGGRAWLADVPPPKVDGRSLVFAMRDAGRLVRALASPIVAMVPNGFTADAPDGTGPFKFTTRGDAVVLARNPLAARGPSYLEEIVVRAAPDLAASLRAFESGSDDLGWLGSGLHEPRAGSRPFDLGAAAWAVLFTGRDASSWDAPGVAQRICDGIPPARLSYLALGPAWTTEPEQGWGGPPTSLYVRDDAPWLVEVAKAISATISRPSHEVTAKTVAASEIAQRRTSRGHTLLLDVVRPVAPGSFAAMVALATADNALRASELVQHPPKLGEIPPRTMTRTMHCGVVGEIRVQGGRAPDVQLATSSTTSGFDLGASTRARPR